ncbi:MAG: glycosyltransferase family 4 protein [Lachnospiraceae bacterium]|nr:glycosyltransferase family 4 protein [Lachnospiraceae bacterium]
MKILFAPSDNNATSGAFLSMIKLCDLLQNDYGCEILILLHCGGTGEELLKEKHLKYKKIYSFNWFVPYKPDSLIRKIKKALCYVWMPITRAYNTFAIFKISNLVRKEKIDIVHLNTSCCYVAAEAALRCNVPFVWHIREFLEEDQGRCIWNRKKGYNLMSRANALVGISDGILKKYTDAIPTAKIVKIYNGIDDSDFRCEEHSIFDHDIIKMIIVGAINASKGQEQAILACKLLVDNGMNNFELLVVGQESDYSKRLQSKVHELKLDQYVKFTGATKNTAPLYQTSDITLMCSKAEAFGRVTVEAMMSGSLVIGANAGGTSELIEDNVTGLLYESGNVNDLANKIIYAALHRSEAKGIAKRGQTFMLNNMTAKKNAKNVYDLYKQILK